METASALLSKMIDAYGQQLFGLVVFVVVVVLSIIGAAWFWAKFVRPDLRARLSVEKERTEQATCFRDATRDLRDMSRTLRAGAKDIRIAQRSAPCRCPRRRKA